MATLSITEISSTRVTWTISGLALDWNSSNYLSGGIATSPATNTTTPPSGILDSETAPSTGTDDFVSERTPAIFTEDTSYTVYAYVVSAATGVYLSAGGPITFSTIPALFGFSTYEEDGDINLYIASEPLSKVDEFRIRVVTGSTTVLETEIPNTNAEMVTYLITGLSTSTNYSISVFPRNNGTSGTGRIKSNVFVYNSLPTPSFSFNSSTKELTVTGTADYYFIEALLRYIKLNS